MKHIYVILVFSFINKFILKFKVKSGGNTFTNLRLFFEAIIVGEDSSLLSECVSINVFLSFSILTILIQILKVS